MNDHTIPEIDSVISESGSRFSSAPWVNTINNMDICLAGCGGIGSWTGLLLSRLNPNSLSLWDPDSVDTSNTSGQLFTFQDRNRLKVEALKECLKRYSNYWRATAIAFAYEPYSNPTKPIMICGFDNMAARKEFFDAWETNLWRHESSLFIDGRLAAEEFQIFALTKDNPERIEEYKSKYLFPDEEADATVCSYKQTSHIAAMIASYIVSIVVNFCANLSQDSPLPREVPFLTTYRADYMDLKIKR